MKRWVDVKQPFSIQPYIHHFFILRDNKLKLKWSHWISSDFAEKKENSNLVKWNVFIAFNGKLPPVKFQFNAFIALTEKSNLKSFSYNLNKTFVLCIYFMHLLILGILMEMNQKTKEKTNFHHDFPTLTTNNFHVSFLIPSFLFAFCLPKIYFQI